MPIRRQPSINQQRHKNYRQQRHAQFNKSLQLRRQEVSANAMLLNNDLVTLYICTFETVAN